MAEAFLYELLQMQNSVHNPEERCGICLESYGTLSRESGTIEVEIRLPCKHTVGSACIATWLRTNNTCPVCRHEFFPAQPRPYLEHDIMDDEEEYDQVEDDDDQLNIRELNEDYCGQLGLDMEICMISGLIIQKLSEWQHLTDGHTNYCIVAVSIYMASHLTREPRSPREIEAVTNVEADHIRFTYDSIFSERSGLADADLLSLLEDAFDEVEPLNFPAPGYESTDEQIEDRHATEVLKMACHLGCNELGLDVRVAEFSNRMAANLYAAGCMADFSPKVLAAVSIFMVSHVVCSPVTVKRVAEAVEINEVAVRSAYDVAYFIRYELIEESWLEDLGRGNQDSVLGRLVSPSVFI